MQTPNINNLLQTTHAKETQKVGAAASQEQISSKDQLDAAIVDSSSVSLQVKDNPLSLVQQSAIEHINDLLREEFGANALETAYESGIDVSPEATAERIVSMSTSFYNSFRSNHPELSDEEARSQFIDVISAGIDQGFGEARDILESLSILEGEIEENVDTTYELVQVGLQDFLDAAEEFDGSELSDFSDALDDDDLIF